MVTVSREEFEKAFKRMQGNFRIEGIEIKDEERELFYSLYTGNISQQEFYKSLGVEDPFNV